MLLNIAQSPQNTLVHADALGGKALRVAQQLQKQQPHRKLVEPSVRLVAVNGGPDEILNQILHGDKVGGVKLQRKRGGILAREAVQKEIAHDVPLTQHSKSRMKKLRQHNDVHADIALPGRENLMAARLIEKEQIPFMKDDCFFPLEDVRDASLTNIHDFHIIMAVAWKISKTGMRGNVH